MMKKKEISWYMSRDSIQGKLSFSRRSDDREWERVTCIPKSVMFVYDVVLFFFHFLGKTIRTMYSVLYMLGGVA